MAFPGFILLLCTFVFVWWLEDLTALSNEQLKASWKCGQQSSQSGAAIVHFRRSSLHEAVRVDASRFQLIRKCNVTPVFYRFVPWIFFIDVSSYKGRKFVSLRLAFITAIHGRSVVCFCQNRPIHCVKRHFRQRPYPPTMATFKSMFELSIFSILHRIYSMPSWWRFITVIYRFSLFDKETMVHGRL